jgi:hypothetical protein
MRLLWRTVCCLFIASVALVAGFTSPPILQKAPHVRPIFLQQQAKDEQPIILNTKDESDVFERSIEVKNSAGSTTRKFLSEKQIGIFVLATVSSYANYGFVPKAKH